MTSYFSTDALKLGFNQKKMTVHPYLQESTQDAIFPIMYIKKIGIDMTRVQGSFSSIHSSTGFFTVQLVYVRDTKVYRSVVEFHHTGDSTEILHIIQCLLVDENIDETG